MGYALPRSLVLAIALLIGILAPAQTQTPHSSTQPSPTVSGSLESHLSLGRELIARRDLKGAIQEYRAAVTIAPESPEANSQLGLLLDSTGAAQESLYYLRKWVKLEPSSAKAHYNLGHTLQSVNDPEGAIAEYRETIRLDPKHERAHENLANLLDDKGLHDEAIAEYRIALQLSPDDADLHRNFGLALKRSGNRDEAIAEYRKALHLNISDISDRAQIHFSIAQMLDAKQDPSGAIVEYRAAIELFPNIALGHYYLGRDLRDTGDMAGALHEFQTASSLDPKNTTYAKALQDLQQQMNH